MLGAIFHKIAILIDISKEVSTRVAFIGLLLAALSPIFIILGVCSHNPNAFVHNFIEIVVGDVIISAILFVWGQI